MYQVPVEGLETIRKTRKKVKHILSDIGLEDCQNLLEELKNSAPGDDVFQETEWADLTEGFNKRRKKKWIYRTKALCCNLCGYSTLNWRNFKSHLQCKHEYERNKGALSPCPVCSFVGHPKVARKHVWLFHAPQPPTATSTDTATQGLLVTSKKQEKYRCQKCSFQSSVLLAIKKHVLLAHLGNMKMLTQFSRRNLHKKDPQKPLKYHCKECGMALQNLDHMLHHVLTTPAHRSVNWHVRPFISENKNYLASKQIPPALPLQQPGTLYPASALTQLASAEAKGLLKPGTAITFQSAFPPGAVPARMPLPGGIGPGMVRITTPASKQVPLAAGALGQNPVQLWPQQVLLPNMPRMGGTGSRPFMVTQKPPLNQTTPQSTMVSSRSRVSHLIPTGNKINGLPTYTLAAHKLPLPVSKEPPRNTASPLQPIKPRSNPQAKRWIACPICNELFPSDVYQVHTEVVHKATSKHECLAAKAPFLRKMPDKTVRCLMCKVAVSEKVLLEHLLHGLDCIYCPSKFNSIKKLVEHLKEHNPSQKAYCDFIRQEYRLYTNDSGKLMFPYFDMKTSVPRQMLGDSELNLALVTKSLDPIFVKMLPSSQLAVCSTPMKTTRTCCLFCDENCHTAERYQQHLIQKHSVDTTVHAILKTAAFKCIYCNGVYTGRVTQKGIASHLRRCQCAQKATTEKAPTDTEKPLTNGQVVPSASSNGETILPPAVISGQPVMPDQKLQINQMNFGQLPQASVPDVLEPPQSEEEKMSKLRLEMAWKKAMDANKQEREERAAMRLKLEQERARQPDPTVKLVLDPSGLEQQPAEQRKYFLSKYFHKCPYLTKKESDELSKRLLLSKSEVSILFSKKRMKCMKNINTSKITVLLGFNMAELNKVKHNLLIPEFASADNCDAGALVQSKENKEKATSGKLDEFGEMENMEKSEKTTSGELDESGDKKNMEESDKTTSGELDESREKENMEESEKTTSGELDESQDKANMEESEKITSGELDKSRDKESMEESEKTTLAELDESRDKTTPGELDETGDEENMEESGKAASGELDETGEEEKIEESVKMASGELEVDESGDMENMEKSEKTTSEELDESGDKENVEKTNCQKREMKDKLEEVVEAEMMSH